MQNQEGEITGWKKREQEVSTPKSFQLSDQRPEDRQPLSTLWRKFCLWRTLCFDSKAPSLGEVKFNECDPMFCRILDKIWNISKAEFIFGGEGCVLDNICRCLGIIIGSLGEPYGMNMSLLCARQVLWSLYSLGRLSILIRIMASSRVSSQLNKCKN